MRQVAPFTLVVALGLLLAPPPARARQDLPPPDPRSVLHLLTENDAYGIGRTDRWYTNGLRLGWQSPEGTLPSPIAWLDARLEALFGPARSRWGLAIGQSIYTPVNKRAVVPDPQDRPYAGLLTLELGLDRRTADRLDRFALQFGTVGPAALAEESQDFVHHIINISQPRGWNAQIRNEPILNLYWDRTWRIPSLAPPTLAGLEMDALPNASLALGTALLNVGLGARFRLGEGLAADFGPPRMRPALGTATAPVGEAFGWYVFAGAGGRVVGRDITLNGNTWQDSASAAPRPFVGELELGLAVFWRGIRLSYTHVWRSKEFVSQPRTFEFGSIALSLAF